ncbi:MAG: hypothetical protein JWL77_1491 [Chthonomonadaceae bacterium]|nr:hypothetical protein [Chthonomonadaceae bacterium]
MARQFQDKLCVYCQEHKSTSRHGDHVIARGFFPDGNRTVADVPIRVPACQYCNAASCSAEQYLIALLAPSINSVHPAAGEVARGPVTRSIAVPEAQGVWKRIQKDAQLGILMSADGHYIATTPVVQPEYAAYDNVFRKITKGLYYHHFAAYFPLDYEIALFSADRTSCDQFWIETPGFDLTKLFEIGDGIFRYAYTNSTNDHADMMWLMCFYQGHYFYVRTGPPKKVGDILEYGGSINGIAAGRYILKERSRDLATLCVAATDIYSGLCESPITIQVAPSCLALFRFVGKIK